MMRNHIRLLGILHIVYGLLLFAVTTLVSLLIGVAAHFADHFYVPFSRAYCLGPDLIVRAIPLWVVALVVPVMIGVPGMIGGIGLLMRKNWARIVVTIIGVLCLLDFPFGTAPGIYTLWVVLQPQTKELLTT